MIRISEEDKEIRSVAWSTILIFVGSAVLVTAANVTIWNFILYWVLVVIGLGLFVWGIRLAYRPFRTIRMRQKEIKNDLISYRIENLLLHLSELKLSLVANELQIEKNALLKSHYDSVISKIEVVGQEIQNELNHEKRR